MEPCGMCLSNLLPAVPASDDVMGLGAPPELCGGWGIEQLLGIHHTGRVWSGCMVDWVCWGGELHGFKLSMLAWTTAAAAVAAASTGVQTAALHSQGYEADGGSSSGKWTAKYLATNDGLRAVVSPCGARTLSGLACWSDLVPLCPKPFGL